MRLDRIAQFGAAGVYFGIAAAMLIGIPTVVWLMLQPALVDHNRRVITHSHTFTSANTTAMMRMVQEHKALEVRKLLLDDADIIEAMEAQQAVLAEQVAIQASKMPPNSVNETIVHFLEVNQ